MFAIIVGIEGDTASWCDVVSDDASSGKASHGVQLLGENLLHEIGWDSFLVAEVGPWVDPVSKVFALIKLLEASCMGVLNDIKGEVRVVIFEFLILHGPSGLEAGSSNSEMSQGLFDGTVWDLYLEAVVVHDFVHGGGCTHVHEVGV